MARKLAEREMLTSIPGLVKQLHKIPSDLKSVTTGSSRKLEFVCANCGNPCIKPVVSTVISYKKGHKKVLCVECAKMRSGGNKDIDLFTDYEGLVAQADHRKNKKLGIDYAKLSAGCDQKIWFICAGDQTSFLSSVAFRIKNWNKGKKDVLCNKCRHHGAQPQLKDIRIFKKYLSKNNPKEIRYRFTHSNIIANFICSVCSIEHKAKIRAKTSAIEKGVGIRCQKCTKVYNNRPQNDSQRIRVKYPRLVKEYDAQKNWPYTIDDYKCSSSEKRAWNCAECGHNWEAMIVNRTTGKGCPNCACVTPVMMRLKKLVQEILPIIDTLTPAALHALFAPFSNSANKRIRLIVPVLRANRLPPEELEKFIHDKRSVLDDLVENAENDEENLFAPKDIASSEQTFAEALKSGDEVVDPVKILKGADQFYEIAKRLDIAEDIEEFVCSQAIYKIWQYAYRDENSALKKMYQEYSGERKISKEIRRRFVEELNNVQKFKIPPGYKGVHDNLFLVQKQIVMDLKRKQFVGNWSGTGTGKTLAAIIASRDKIFQSKLTLVICPNAIVDYWATEIKNAFPKSSVFTDVSNVKMGTYTYLILNFEKFQQSNSKNLVAEILRYKIGLLVLDEIQFVKSRNEDSSIRRSNVLALRRLAQGTNKELRVLGMSATPVLNELSEGKSLLQMITNEKYDHLAVMPTIKNAIGLYKEFANIGRRYMPDYANKAQVRIFEVDASSACRSIIGPGTKINPYSIERALLPVRLATIVDNIKKNEKVVLYTQFVTGFVEPLKTALQKAGHSVGVYIGEEKSGLIEFLQGKINVLIASSCITTGIDGLQKVSSKLIFVSLPWTHAALLQIVGRLERQGMRKQKLEIVLIRTFGMNDAGEKWSWCYYREAILSDKKTLADTATDGIVSEDKNLSPAASAKAFQEILRKMDTGSAAA